MEFESCTTSCDVCLYTILVNLYTSSSLVQSYSVLRFYKVDGLWAGHQEAEKGLVDLWQYVKDLEDQLHKKGSWQVAKVMQIRREDSSTIQKQRVRTSQQVQSSIPGCPASAVVTTYAPAPI